MLDCLEFTDGLAELFAPTAMCKRIFVHRTCKTQGACRYAHTLHAAGHAQRRPGVMCTFLTAEHGAVWEADTIQVYVAGGLAH